MYSYLDMVWMSGIYDSLLLSHRHKQSHSIHHKSTAVIMMFFKMPLANRMAVYRGLFNSGSCVAAAMHQLVG